MCMCVCVCASSNLKFSSPYPTQPLNAIRKNKKFVTKS